MPQLRDLELLIESKYPVIAVETEEEGRWTPVDALTRPPPKDGFPKDRQPLQALAKVAAAREDGLCLFKDLHKYFEDPAVVRAEEVASLRAWASTRTVPAS